MTLLRTLAALAALLVSSAALADTDCEEPIEQWKPRDALRKQVETAGWTVQRIKVDDGCYEVRGTDRRGNRVKAKYGPATLQLRSLEVEFGSDADASDYFRPVRPSAVRPQPASAQEQRK